MQKNTYDKPFKSYEEQVDHLINNYGLIVQDRNFAISALQSLTYYDLINGYKEIFMVNDKFIAGTTIEDVYTMCLIDKGFQAILFEYTTIVENSFKSKLAYIISQNFGVVEQEYLNPACYYKTNNKIRFSDVATSCKAIHDGSKPVPQPTKHYLESHNHIPAWILFKNLSFSNAVNLFQLLKRPEKKAIVELLVPDVNLSYSEKVAFVVNALNLIRLYRNKIAHNLKFVTYKASRYRMAPKTMIKLMQGSNLLSWRDINKHNRGLEDTYAYVLCVLYLLQVPYLKSVFARSLMLMFQNMKNADDLRFGDCFCKYCKVVNIPENFAELLENI